MACPTGLETFELTAIQLTRVMYAVDQEASTGTLVFETTKLRPITGQSIDVI